MIFRKRLVEDIESMKKYYPNILDKDFMNLIKLDPTYKQGSTSAGKYARWILSLADKGKLNDLGHIKDLLTRFEEKKRSLVNKDIMSYKSVQEVEDTLNALVNDETLTDRQKERKLRNSYEDAKLVAEDANWEVWIPGSYAASCTLGKGTKWCTAYSKDSYYYNNYNAEGDLIVFINKHDPKDKYQFHYETNSFMNALDEPVDFFEFKDRLSSNIQNYLIDKYPELEQLMSFDGVWVYDESFPGILIKHIKTVVIPENIVRIPPNTFDGFPKLEDVKIQGAALKKIDRYAFRGCENLRTINLPESVQSIGAYAFALCSHLQNINIPNGVKIIGKSAFYATGLQELHLPDNIVSIGSNAFENCAKLQKLKLPSSIRQIEDWTFSSCHSLKNVEIPEGIEDIGADAFSYSGLLSVNLPQSIQRILTDAFTASHLTNIYYAGTEAQWAEIYKSSYWLDGVEHYTIHCTDGDIEGFFQENFKMRFKTRLTEDIDSMRKYYPDIDDDTFMEYIKLDPTYKEGSKNPGSYAKWILALVTRNKGKLPDAGHIKDILTRFEESKNNLKDKNISRFKTVEELENYLNDESNYKDLSKRQELRQTQKAVRSSDLNKDAVLVYEDNNWEVWTPKTYEASCKLGRGSKWCTATTESDYYYNMYSNEGDLFVNINKHDPEEKYQFHFESSQFMDKDDNSIDVGKFLNKEGNEGLKKFYRDRILKSVFGENVKEDEPIEVTIDAARLSDSFENIDYRLLTDPFEVVSEWDYDVFDFDYLYDLSDEAKQVLHHLTGLSEEEAQDILKYSDDDKYYDTLYSAYSFADYEARISAAQREARQAVVDGINEAIKPYATLEDPSYDGILKFKIIPRDFIDMLYLDYGIEYNYNSPAFLLEDLISHEYIRQDPYNEYSDSFDEDIYSEAFIDELYNQLGSNKDVKEDLDMDNLKSVSQEYSSANTSINAAKLPVIFSLVSFKPDTINLDYGGGKFDNATDYLDTLGVTNLIYDPFNRSTTHNKNVLRIVRENDGADTITCSNVLNVIKEPEAREAVIENIHSLLKKGGTAYFTVYEGRGDGIEGPTKSGYQLNRKTVEYMKEIADIFDFVNRKGKLIVARD